MRFTKLRGQHILKDERVARKIVEAAGLVADDAVIEVGPGLGVLTRLIVPRVKEYVGVELDPRFAEALRAEFGTQRIIEGDFLKVGVPDGLTAGRYKLISNLPYNITSAFMKKVLTLEHPPELVVVMIQKEVALRIAARERFSMLGLECNLYASCARLFDVPPGAFSPPPRVDSSVVEIRPYPDGVLEEKWGINRESAEDILRFAAIFFRNPRKMMANALGSARSGDIKSALSRISVRPDARPADLSLGNWIDLWKIAGA